MDTVKERLGQTRESSIDIYSPHCKIASRKQLPGTETQPQCFVVAKGLGWGVEIGRARGRGNIFCSLADSYLFITAGTNTIL